MASSSSEDEPFEDALTGSESLTPPDLDNSIADSKRSVDLFLENKFAASLDCMKPWAHCSIYHALGNGTMLFMQALLSMAPSDIEQAVEALKKSVYVCNRKRKRRTMTKYVRSADYNSYTEEEVHAELCYAECLLLTSILTFVKDHNFMNLVKGSLKIRSCYNSYKECLLILESRTFENDLRKKHFESGVKMGVGTFNLMISQLPRRVLALLECIGFSGNKALGLMELDEGYRMTEGLRSPLCALILVTYHTLVTYIFGHGDGDIEYSERILDTMLARYPEAALFIFLSGRVKQLKGQIDAAIETYQRSIDVQQEWKQFHYLCYWELLWCYSFKCDWKQSARCSDILRKECKWSPAIYNYVHASMLYMMVLDGQKDLLPAIAEIMEKVPSLKQRVAGKSIPLEKYVARKSQKFLTQNNHLLLPALELVYIWNSFPMIAKSADLTERILCRIEKVFIDQLEAKESETESLDDYCLALLLRGVCFKSLDRPQKAEHCMREIMQCEKRIKSDVYLVPFAMTELACLKMEESKENNEKEIKDLMDAARKNYHGYPLETLLHFRIHSAMQSLRAKDMDEPLPSMPLHHTIDLDLSDEDELYSDFDQGSFHNVELDVSSSADCSINTEEDLK